LGSRRPNQTASRNGSPWLPGVQKSLLQPNRIQ